VLDALKTFGARLWALANSSRLDREFDRELDSHVHLLTDENIERGMTPDEARRMALVRTGNRASLRARHREARGLPALESALQDLAFALRLIGKNAGFSAAAIVTIALGIGVNAVGFSIIHAAFLRGMPFEDGKALHMVAWTTDANRRSNSSLPEFELWRDRARSFSGLAAFDTTSLSLSDDHAPPEQVDAAWVSANAFEVLEQPPLLGRALVADDGRSGADPVVVIGASVWRHRYGGDPSIVGKPVRFNGRPATIVGVMPERMQFPTTANLWAPLMRTEEMERRGTRVLSVFGRLDRSIDRRTAQAELDGLAKQALPSDPEATKGLVGVRVETFNDFFIGGKARPMFLVVMGAVCFVLLIACVNVANLMLSRAVTRGREMAVRVSMGATRIRLVGQLLIESAVLSVLGGGLGLWLASTAIGRFDAALEGSGRPYWLTFSVDATVVGYVAAICVLTTMLFGLAPALQISKTNANDVLKEGGRGAVGSRRAQWMTGSLVVGELALTVVLLVGAGLMVRSFFNVYSMDIGVPTDGLMSMRVQLPEERYGSPEARQRFFTQVAMRLAANPGLDSVSVTSAAPPFDSGERLLEVEGQSPETASRWVSTVTISPTFFATLKAPILRGRGFQAADGAADVDNVIVNQQFVERTFARADPIGQRIRLKERNGSPGAWHTIVGVSSSIRHGSFQDFGTNPVVYSLSDRQPPREAAFLIRSALPPSVVMNTVRHEVQAMDSDQPVLAIQTVAEAIAEASWPLRVFGALFAVFGVIALTLSAVGLYGVMAYAVSQRTQEIGVRMALGASWRQVSGQVLRRGLRHLSLGLAIGGLGALALSRVLQRVVVQIEPADPTTFAAIAALLTLVTVLACLVPARRAARVDPLIALRAE
jgi:putative ABC transport system permease protein